MELSKVIENRRSIRHFNNEEIKKEEIAEILKYGTLAPSAKNRQPWNFVVIYNDKDLKKKIADILKNKYEAAALTSEVIATSQALILVYGEIDDLIFDVQSIGACIENMCLKAYDMNIGSLWIGFILQIEKELQELLNTPSKHKLIAALALGHYDHNPSPKNRIDYQNITVWL